MITIFKYPIKIIDYQEVEMPRGAKVISAQAQGGSLCLWAAVDTDQPVERRSIAVYGTGHPIPADFTSQYVGTALMHGGSLVWHVFADTGSEVQS